jgi:DNA-binding NarL/FixJ family response regulator
VSVVRILLADDHTMVRAGLRALLESMEGIAVVAEAGNGREAVELARSHHPDIAVLDISMRELNGIDAGVQIRAERPETRVLILSMHTSQEFVHRALKSGVSGYLVKEAAPLELRMAIETLMRGEVYLSPRISRQVVSGLADGAGGGGEAPLESLTARQREILQMLAEGKSTKAMAFLLGVSIKTVETHRAGIMDRLGIHDLAGLVIYAARHKLVSLEPR